MKQTIALSSFIDAFQKAGRYDELGGYTALKALFEHLTEWEESTGEELELDVIALCCDYGYVTGLDDFNTQYGEDCESMDDIEAKTNVIIVDEQSFIVASY